MICIQYIHFKSIFNISLLHPLPKARNAGVDGRHGVVTGSDADAGQPKKKPTVFQFRHQGAPWVALANVGTFSDALRAQLSLQNGNVSKLRYLMFEKCCLSGHKPTQVLRFFFKIKPIPNNVIVPVILVVASFWDFNSRILLLISSSHRAFATWTLPM